MVVLIHLYGKQESVLGWQLIFEQEKIPYKYLGETIKKWGPVNIVVGTPKIEVTKKTGVTIFEPEVNFHKDGWRNIVSEIRDGRNEKIKVIAITDLPESVKGEKYGSFSLYDDYCNISYPLVIFKNKQVNFSFNLSEQLTFQGYGWRNLADKISGGEQSLAQVSIIDKSGIIDFLVNVLKKSFEAAKLPYVHLWYYPKRYKNVFLFRQDIDYIDVQGLKNSLKTSRDYGIRGSYFLNTSGDEEYEDIKETKIQRKPVIKSNLKLLNLLLKDGNEIAGHGYRHDVFDTEQQNIKNINRANKEIEKKLKTKVVGFAAPGGIWHHNLAAAMQKCKLIYSSDNCLSNGGFPFFPMLKNKFSSVLEIPVGWVSDAIYEGNLTRKNCLSLKRYFLNYSRQQIKSNKPIGLLGHPHIGGKMAIALWGSVFEMVSKRKLLNLTFKEWGEWWKSRNKKNISYKFYKNRIKIYTTNTSDVVEIIYKGKKILTNQKIIYLPKEGEETQ